MGRYMYIHTCIQKDVSTYLTCVHLISEALQRHMDFKRNGMECGFKNQYKHSSISFR